MFGFDIIDFTFNLMYTWSVSNNNMLPIRNAGWLKYNTSSTLADQMASLPFLIVSYDVTM